MNARCFWASSGQDECIDVGNVGSSWLMLELAGHERETMILLVSRR
jgi:hypothetical protein